MIVSNHSHIFNLYFSFKFLNILDFNILRFYLGLTTQIFSLVGDLVVLKNLEVNFFQMLFLSFIELRRFHFITFIYNN